MASRVSQASFSDQPVDISIYDNARSSHETLEMMIALFAMMHEQAAIQKQITRKLSQDLFKHQSDAAAHPRNAAIAMLAFTIISATLSVAGSVIANSPNIAEKAHSLCARLAPSISAKVFGNAYNFNTFSKIIQDTSSATSTVISKGGDAATSFGSALSAQAQAEATRLQFAQQESAEERRRKQESMDRLMNDIQKHLEAHTSANRAVIGR